MISNLVDRAIFLIRGVNCGNVMVTPDAAWGYCEWATFRTKKGWEFVVFNDCDEFDYFEKITSPEGEVWNYVDGNEDECDRLDLLCGQIDNDYRAQWGIV